MVLVLVIALPVSAFASIEDISVNGDIWRVSEDEYGAVVPANATGTYAFPGKFMPSEFGGKPIADVIFRIRGCPLSPTFYLVITDGNGVTNTFKDGYCETGRLSIALTSGAKSLTAKLVATTPSDKERYMNIAEVTLGNGQGGSTDPGGTDPGGGGTDPGGSCGCAPLNSEFNDETRMLGWGSVPNGTYEVVVTYPSGSKVRLTPSTSAVRIAPNIEGTVKVQAVDMSGKVLAEDQFPVLAQPGSTDPGTDPGGGTTDPGGTDPGGEEEPCPAGCQALKDALACPDFDEYLGKWADMIRSTYPPPPDWDYVASTMRDKIVPAMGQELVNRSPEIARIIADEFQSREKPVSPPPSVPSFTPSVPRVQDTPKVTGDLNSNVPSYTPDYSQDKPFEILDPGKLEFNDNSDQGYKYNTDGSKPPDYKPGGGDPSAADPGYNMQETEEPQPPTYEYSPAASKPAPDYKTEETPEEEPPNYNTGGEHTGDYRNYKYQQEGPQPDYNGK